MAFIIVEFTVFMIGVATHMTFFNLGEHHMYGLRYLQLFLGVFFASVLALVEVAGVPLQHGVQYAVNLAGSFLCGLFGSLVTYRLFLSPLSNFPGPFLAKITNLSFSARLSKYDAHDRMLALHQKHGDFVRIGSSDLSITHPEAVAAIYGRGSKCTKADWYDLTLPQISMQTTRKRDEHTQRRRIWAGAFSDTMLRGYEARIKIYKDQLLTRVSTMNEEPINATEIFNQYTFDITGDLAFGVSFRMLQSDENHWAIRLLRKGMEPLGLLLPMWCFRLLLHIPGASKDWLAFKDYCSQKLDERMKVGLQRCFHQYREAHTDALFEKTKVVTPNITSFLLEPWQHKRPLDHDLKMLQGDTQLIVVAGSDTTASTLTSILYELTKQPYYISEIRKVLNPLVESGESLSDQKLQSVDLLNGVINESLRLHPPAGLALQRKTPPEGITIGEVHIPGNTTVSCPQYVVGRREKIYVDASHFQPERWYSKREMIKEPNAYAPFSLGTYNCIGKPLALLVLRGTLADLILNFDISLAPKEDRETYVKQTKTRFNVMPGPLYLTFRKRRT